MIADVTRVLERVRERHGGALLEPEGLVLARALGLGVPRHEVVASADEAARIDLAGWPGDRVAVKVVSREVTHRSDVGGVQVVDRDPLDVAAAVARMAGRLGGPGVRWIVEEWVPGVGGPGAELLLGLRVTREFGPVVTVAPGGLLAEDLAASLAADQGPLFVSPGLEEGPRLRRLLESRAFLRPVVHGARGRPALLGVERLLALVARLLELAEAGAAQGLVEFEMNPVLLTTSGPVAVDALGRVEIAPGPPSPPPRPLGSIEALLRPGSVAVMGVSRRLNPGRVILRNLLAAGFPADRVTVIKAGEEQVDGCRTVPALTAMDGPVDLLVVSVAAEAVPGVMEEVLAGRRAVAVVLIPGGMEASGPDGDPPPAQRVRELLARASRGTARPVVNGPNCLGVRSEPGRVDTLFIPRERLSIPSGPADPVAVVSQSGAFAIARLSALPRLNPRYLVTLGNQIDLTVADYLTHWVDEPEVRVAACYVEGFRPGDGRAFLDAAARFTASERQVLLYRGGRTAAGSAAAASHTAAMGGDWPVTRELARLAGVHVADTLQDFEDRLAVLAAWARRDPPGPAVGVVSNAGFECVAVADRLGSGRMADLAPTTRRALAGLLADEGLAGVVDVANPFDVTPTMGDRGFVEAVRLVLADPRVQVGVVGCVPLTPALRTLPSDAGDGGELAGPGGLAAGLVALWRETRKPWLVVVDGGPLYEPFRATLADAGIPVLTRADRAGAAAGL